jgi:hypothetical protein
MASRVSKFWLMIMPLVLAVILTGCRPAGVADWLATIDQKIGQGFQLIENNKATAPQAEETGSQPKTAELTKEQQERIDQWLKDNNLNRYGDPEGTMYAGGTPLFNEQTGESIDRFDYILDKIPGILKKIE